MRHENISGSLGGIYSAEDQVNLKIKTCVWSVSILTDELLHRHSGNTCAETLKELCELIREQEGIKLLLSSERCL